jgi:hypothetical protein
MTNELIIKFIIGTIGVYIVFWFIGLIIEPFVELTNGILTIEIISYIFCNTIPRAIASAILTAAFVWGQNNKN